MSIRAFLTKPRPMHRTLAVGLGLVMVCAAALMGGAQSFANLEGVAVLAGAGVALAAAGWLLSESHLQWVFTAALLFNIAAAAVALLA